MFPLFCLIRVRARAKESIALLFLCACLVLTACGEGQPSPTSFAFSDTHFLTFITFQPGAQNTVSGSWSKDTADTGTFLRVSYTLTGTQNGSSFSFSVAGLLPLEGKEDGNMMTMQTTDDQGRNVTQKWIAASRQTYDQLVSGFEAFWQVRFKLTALSGLLSLLPVNSDPATAQYQVIGMQQRVDTLKSTWALVQASSNECQDLDSLRGEYPLTDFTLPDPEKSDLAGDIAGVNDAWQYAQHLSIPNVSGLSLSWKISKSDLTTSLQPATTALSQLRDATAQAQKDMQPIQQEYNQIASQIQAEQQKCGVAPSS